MSQKSLGNLYENKLCDMLKKYGYWCHRMVDNQFGQPCDVVAMNGKKSMLIDVKHCKGDRFYLDRIEPNQSTCFQYAYECGVKDCGFAIWFDDDQVFKWLPYNSIDWSDSSIHKTRLEKMELKLCF